MITNYYVLIQPNFVSRTPKHVGSQPAASATLQVPNSMSADDIMMLSTWRHPRTVNGLRV